MDGWEEEVTTHVFLQYNYVEWVEDEIRIPVEKLSSPTWGGWGYRRRPSTGSVIQVYEYVCVDIKEVFKEGPEKKPLIK